MADERFTIETVLELDDRLTAKLAAATRQQKGFTDATQRSERAAKKLGAVDIRPRIDVQDAAAKAKLAGFERSATHFSRKKFAARLDIDDRPARKTLDSLDRRLAQSGAPGLGKGAALLAGFGGGIAARLTPAILSAVATPFTANVELQSQRANLIAFTGSLAETDAILVKMRRNADVTPFATNEVIDSAAQLTLAARNAGVELERLVKDAEILAAINPAEGLRGATFSLKEAISGDFVSLQERFNISRSLVNQLKDEGLTGILLVEEAMRRQGMTWEIVERQGKTMQGRLSTLSSTFAELARRVAEPTFSRLSDELGKTNDGLQTQRTELEKTADEVGTWLGETIGEFIDANRRLNEQMEATKWSPFGDEGALFAAIRLWNTYWAARTGAAALWAAGSPVVPVAGAGSGGGRGGFSDMGSQGALQTPFPYPARGRSSLLDVDPRSRGGGFELLPASHGLGDASLSQAAGLAQQAVRSVDSLGAAWAAVNAELARSPSAMAAMQSSTQALVGELFNAQTALDGLDQRLAEVGTRKGQLSGWRAMITEGLDQPGVDAELRKAGAQAIAQIDVGMREADIEGLRTAVARVFEGDKVVELGQKIDALSEPVDEQKRNVQTYEVQWGDTLSAIERRFGVFRDQITRMGRQIVDANRIYAGETLEIWTTAPGGTLPPSSASTLGPVSRAGGGPIYEDVVGIGAETGRTWAFHKGESVDASGGGGGVSVVVESLSVSLAVPSLDRGQAEMIAPQLVDAFAAELARRSRTLRRNVTGAR